MRTAIDALRDAWLKAKLWYVGRYVVMPDHIHLFCSPSRWPAPPLALWVRYWKSTFSCSVGPNIERPIWQHDFWDTQTRDHHHFSEKWEYIRSNPVRAGLVEYSDQWPYQGEIGELGWE